VGKKLPLASKEFHRKKRKAGILECWNNGIMEKQEERRQESGESDG
jgi:hypothetical protein